MLENEYGHAKRELALRQFSRLQERHTNKDYDMLAATDDSEPLRDFAEREPGS